jgi:SARP family transcriptional regulator, regulator of embCAB operon
MTPFAFSPDADHGPVISVLGGFRLWRSGSVQVGVPRASQRLVAFLALCGGVADRAAVAGTLWPEATESHAYSNLRSALARLERTCRQTLHTSKLELGLAEDVMVDLRHSQALARRLLDPATKPQPSDLGSAAFSALSADLLPGWYDDWVQIEAEIWRQLRVHALEALALRLAAGGRWGEAANAAGVAVRADPLRESAHATLIKVHLAEGNQSEAVREFTRYRALLHAELGLEPTPQLCRLVQDLLRRHRCRVGCSAEISP